MALAILHPDTLQTIHLVLHLYVHSIESPCSTDVEVSTACNLYLTYITAKTSHLFKMCHVLSVHPTVLCTQYFLLLHYDRWFLLTRGLTSYWSHLFWPAPCKGSILFLIHSSALPIMNCSHHFFKTGSKDIPLWLL